MALLDLGRRNTPEKAKVGHLSGGALISQPSERSAPPAKSHEEQSVKESSSPLAEAARKDEGRLSGGRTRLRVLWAFSALLMLFFIVSAIRRLALL